jgi:hypothetical protein
MVNTVQPIMDTKTSCMVPKGNYVHLGGRVQNEDAVDILFAWDRVDTGGEPFSTQTCHDLPLVSPQQGLPVDFFPTCTFFLLTSLIWRR